MSVLTIVVIVIACLWLASFVGVLIITKGRPQDAVKMLFGRTEERAERVPARVPVKPDEVIAANFDKRVDAACKAFAYGSIDETEVRSRLFSIANEQAKLEGRDLTPAEVSDIEKGIASLRRPRKMARAVRKAVHR